MSILRLLALGIATLVVALTIDAARAVDGPAPAINYDRQIRPILSNNCFKCHGPDAEERESGLRLDLRDAALAPAESGKRAIVPGKPDASRLIQRINATDRSEVMPPPDSNRKLTAADKELLRRWIADGANYAEHWSFVPLRRPAIPKPKNSAWAKNAIDEFILARLEAEGLAPAPEADRTTLIRRVTLDLTGLPPTPAEIEAFLADRRPDAYERLIERLFDSPHHGERLAVDWLDAARYADTNGYHIDNGRDMTRWRDWVIDSFNHNRPFDQFTIEQLAGDLLPEATLEQQIASGFNRNHMINFEGGAIPEEYHTAYIIDRVNTTGAVWLGLTVGCAQCHDHKFDPISQRDFYSLFAFFYNVPEKGLDGQKGNAAPLVKVPDAAQKQKSDELAAGIRGLEEELAGLSRELDDAQAAWEKTALAESVVRWTILDPDEFRSQGGATLRKLDDKSILASGDNPAAETYTIVARADQTPITALRVEALPDDSLAAKGPGRSNNGNIVLTDLKLAISGPGNSADVQPARFKTASADFSQKDFPAANAIDGDPKSGWAIFPEVGKPHAAIFELDQPIASDAQARLLATLEFQSPFSQHQIGRFRLAVTGAKTPHAVNGLPEKIAQALALLPENRNEEQKNELRTWFRTQVSPAGRALAAEIAGKRQAQAELDKLIPTAMVMQEMPAPRDAFLLIRGQYDKKGEKVTAGVPEHIAAFPQEAPRNRLGLAQWLVGPTQPLTARVVANRYWQMFFGTGLVKTAEDFGSQGEVPSHPDLLDWLAVAFMQGAPSPAVQEAVPPPLRKGGQGGSSADDLRDSTARGATPPNPPLRRGGSATGRRGGSDAGRGVKEGTHWDVRALLRLIVTSATYRQSSVVTPEIYGKDPENRLLARGPRFRLQAEFIRDQALALSGLLNSKIGGASVSPYQPAGLWEELMSRADGKNWTAQTYVQSHGPDLYRRTMYTFWKRTCPPPTLATFDAPDRETCTVRRARTNTPLQALILLNDPTYVEASRKLAERILNEGGTSAEQRLAFAFRLATARQPTASELGVMRKVLETQRAVFKRHPEAAQKLLSVGESPRNEAVDPSEVAAWTTVVSMILNLDETVTKG